LLDDIAERAPVVANRVRGVLSKIFSWSLARDLVEHSPVIGVPKPARERSRDRVLTPQEVGKVWTACESSSSLVALSIQLVLVTAQRGGEIRAMRWADIADSWWTIPQHKSKGGHSHRVFLSPLAHELLSTLDPETEYVFPGARGRTHLTYPYKTFKLISAVAGIPHWTIHDLRRTAATMMTSMKISPFVVERILGHTDNRITAVYDRSSYDDEKREAMVLWGERVRELILP
jgi:integrase